MEDWPYKLSIIIVSYNTRELLGRCLGSALASAGDLPVELLVVDNGSTDGSVDYLKETFPDVRLLESGGNIGFGAANNLGYRHARGEYIVLLNSDAFPVGDSLAASARLMDGHPDVGLAGGRLIGEDGGWRPSARAFPGLWNDFVTLTGLSARHGRSWLMGRPDMTWRNQDKGFACDWVPGAFSIIRRAAIDDAGFFDERFFLYSEEVDLCKRIRMAGWKVAYWPELGIVHMGGASIGLFSGNLVTKHGRQMGLWRLQSQYLYYRKHHGWPKAFMSMLMELAFNRLRYIKNRLGNPDKAEESLVMIELIRRAWALTRGGLRSPGRPWKGA